MRSVSILAVLLGLTCAEAHAQQLPSVALSAGETVILREKIGRQGSVERGKAEWTPFMLAIARRMVGTPIPDAPVPEASPIYEDEGLKPPPIPADRVRLTFMTIAGKHTMLLVENGLGRPISYRARIKSGESSEATDTCLVPANMPSIEHWPYPIESIDISEFRHVDWEPGQPVPCQ